MDGPFSRHIASPPPPHNSHTIVYVCIWAWLLVHACVLLQIFAPIKPNKHIMSLMCDFFFLYPSSESVPVHHHRAGHWHGREPELWLVQHGHGTDQHHRHQWQSSGADSENGESLTCVFIVPWNRTFQNISTFSKRNKDERFLSGSFEPHFWEDSAFMYHIFYSLWNLLCANICTSRTVAPQENRRSVGLMLDIKDLQFLFFFVCSVLVCTHSVAVGTI